MGRFVCFSLCLVFLGLGHCRADGEGLLHKTLHALARALQYAEENVSIINLNAIFCTRVVQEQLQAFLVFQPDVFKNIHHSVEVLRDQAKRIADEGIPFIKDSGDEFYETVAFVLREADKLLWYPSLDTAEEFAVKPLPCSSYNWNETYYISCCSQIAGKGDKPRKKCDISKDCMEYYTAKRQRGYMLPHQVLFWQLMEAWGCVDTISIELRTELCTNVLRDVNEAEILDYPMTHQDLMLEQVGLCGIWGFRDFNKREWLEKILEWQKPSGCYSIREPYKCYDDLSEKIHRRVKRYENIHEDGCYSHKTGVALLALAASLRFEAEKAYLTLDTKQESCYFFSGIAQFTIVIAAMILVFCVMKRRWISNFL